MNSFANIVIKLTSMLPNLSTNLKLRIYMRLKTLKKLRTGNFNSKSIDLYKKKSAIGKKQHLKLIVT